LKKTTWCTFFPIFSFFIFEHFSQKKWKKITRTSMAAAVTSLPRVCFFIFHYESGLVLKTVFDKKIWCAFLPFFPFFHFDHFAQKKWKKNTRTSTVAAVPSSPRVRFHLLFVWKMSIYHIFFQIASARAHYTYAFIPTCAKTWPAVHTPPNPCSRRAGTPSSSLLPLTHSFLHPLSSHA